MSRRDRSKDEFGRVLVMLGCISCLIYVAINAVWLQPSITRGWSNRPISVVAGYTLASLVWLLAVRHVIRRFPRERPPEQDPSRVWLPTVVAFALSFRLIQLVCFPILEIDIYRYVWDGIVANQAVSPYRFSPHDVLTAKIAIEDADLRKVVAASTASASHHEILSRVHFAKLTTLYPPISQAVFSLTTWLVPDDATVAIHLTAMKLVLLVFELGTLELVCKLLTSVRLPVLWCIIYAWNPLAIKEIANSGHLDSIAVFFAVAAVYCLIESVVRGGEVKWAATCGLSLAAGTAAKLFPVVLFPLAFCSLAAVKLRAGVAFALVAIVTTTMCMVPMMWQHPALEDGGLGEASTNKGIERDGLTQFLSRWRMNEVYFGVLYENIRPNRMEKSVNRPWYAVVPNAWRLDLANRLWPGEHASRNAYLLARFALLASFAAIYLWILRRAKTNDFRHDVILESCFWILAVFFFAQPTQNPWYWLWALPFLPFASNRGWLMVSVYLTVYYLRFWLRSTTHDVEFLGERYVGAGIFDHLVVWGEHGAILLSVVLGSLRSDEPNRANRQ